jgi:hypothetical protein
MRGPAVCDVDVDSIGAADWVGVPAEADLARIPPASDAVERHPEKKDVFGFGASPLGRTGFGDDTLEA